MRAESLLFTEPLRTKCKPLFDSYTDLAKCVKGQGYGKTINSITVYLHNVFVSGAKPASENLQRAILKAVKERLDPEHDYDEVEMWVIDLFYIARVEAREKALGPPHQLYSRELLLRIGREIENGKSMICFWPDRIIVGYNVVHIYGAYVLDYILNKIKKGSAKTKKDKTTNKLSLYKFYLHDEYMAMNFWQDLAHDRLTKSENPKELSKLIEKVNKEYLKVYAYPSQYCTHPTIIFNIEKLMESEGYVFFQHMDEWVFTVRASMAKMSIRDIERFSYDIYQPFTYKLDEYNVKEITFKEGYRPDGLRIIGKIDVKSRKNKKG